MKIAILYICTGKYNQFFKGFYESSEKFFLSGKAEKEYFVFTDDMNLSDAPNVHLNYKKYEGFPLDSLFRFDMFLRVKDEILQCDYAYFFNANMLFISYVGEEFLPKQSDMTAVIHPGQYRRMPCLYPYERNKRSTAYIAPFEGEYHYYMGSLNGGKSDAFVRFAEVCSKRTHQDFDNGIIALFHDESHLNKYMRDVNGEGLSPMYAVPEDEKVFYEPKIIIRDKVKAFPDCLDFTKGRKFSVWARIKKGGWMFWNIFRWYLKF